MVNPRIPIAARHEGEYVLAAHQLYNDQSGISRQPDLATLSQLHLVLVDRECIASSIIASNVVETGNLPGVVLPGHFKAFWADQPLSILHPLGSLTNTLPRKSPIDEKARSVQTSLNPSHTLLQTPHTLQQPPQRQNVPQIHPLQLLLPPLLQTRAFHRRDAMELPRDPENSKNEN
ncbi:hypothetical protein Vi05172_g11584 [Venturia inaequalis]|nr:hypothetical protein Vi05172_g11584 [Venturia inaequalis]